MRKNSGYSGSGDGGCFSPQDFLELARIEESSVKHMDSLGFDTAPETRLAAALRFAAAVTAERDQARADLAQETDHCRDTARALRQITTRWDQARQKLADAPHDSSCLIDWGGEGDNVYHYPNAGKCCCWKAGL